MDIIRVSKLSVANDNALDRAKIAMESMQEAARRETMSRLAMKEAIEEMMDSHTIFIETLDELDESLERLDKNMNLYNHGLEDIAGKLETGQRLHEKLAKTMDNYLEGKA